LHVEIAVDPDSPPIVKIAKIVSTLALLVPWLQMSVEFAEGQLDISIDRVEFVGPTEHGRQHAFIEGMKIHNGG
jgi:hypothetical protein